MKKRVEEIKQILEALGAEVEFVTKKTTALIVGDAPGSKVQKAEKLEVACITLADLDDLLQSHQ